MGCVSSEPTSCHAPVFQFCAFLINNLDLKGAVRIDPTQKLAGILVPVFALRSRQDLGIGDTECVREMIDWCARHQFSVLQVLPINETSDDNSPYNAISSMALDPTTLAVSPEGIPDLSPAAFRKIAAPFLLEELRRGPVAYRKVKPLKMRLLRTAFSSFLKKQHAKNSTRARQFQQFLSANHHWIANYSLFRALMELRQNSPVWEEWPPEHQAPSDARNWLSSLPEAERRRVDEDALFFSYAQWIAREQWIGLKRHAEKKGVLLMGDIPFGVGRCSADVWANREMFDLKWSCGAPPESFFKPDLFTERWGQNWGVPLYHWDRMKENSFSWWKARVRATSEIFHLFRIDHVLGFYRVYAFPWQPQQNGEFTHLSHHEARGRTGGELPRFWPDDDGNEDKKNKNRLQGEELLRMVLETAGKTGVVAEDLGMVPDYVRPSLLHLGIPGFKIPIFERNQDGSYKDSSQYSPLSVATPGTHDHEPLAALWKRWSSSPDHAAERRHLLSWIGWDPDRAPQDLTPELHAAIVRKLLGCSSWLAVLMITDLFAQTARFNQPGPASDSNWSERLSVPVGEFDRDPAIISCLRRLEPCLPRK